MTALSSVPLWPDWFPSFVRRLRLPQALTIAFVIAVTLGLRALNLNDPLWLDEMHTSWVVSDSILDVTSRAAIGNQTPLYFWLNWFIAAVYESEVSLRLISFLSAGALAGLVADTLWRWCESAKVPPVGPALCGGLLVAVDPVFIFYGTEARPYALLQLVAFWRLRQLSLLSATPTRNQRLSMIISGAAMVWLHLTGGLIFAGELAAILFWKWHGRNSYSLRNWLVDLAVISVACLPLAWLISFVFGRRQNFESMIPSPTLTGAFQILHGEELFWPLVIGGVLAFVLDRFVIRGTNALPEEPPVTQESPEVERFLPGRFVYIAAGPLVWALATMSFSAVLHLLGIAPLFWGRYLIAVIVAIPVAIGAVCGVRSTPLGMFLALLVMALCVQRTGLNQRLFNQDELGHRAIDDRRLDWDENSTEPWPRFADVRRGLDRPEKSTPFLVDAGLIERDVSWKSNTEIERDYSCFPMRSKDPYGLGRPTNSWGLPRDWREGGNRPYLPPEAIESYLKNHGIVILVLSKSEANTDGSRLVGIIADETGNHCHMAATAVELHGKATLYWIMPGERRNYYR